MLSEQRLILYHKHRSSGRTLFLRLAETVCQFGGIAPSAHIVASRIGGDQVNEDLSDLIRTAEQHLGLAEGSLELDREFHVTLSEPQAATQVYLARFTAIDPPQAELVEQSGKFITLTEARRLPSTDLELLRLAYSVIMDDLA